MNKWEFENEALDSKLCLLRFTKHIWIPVLATVIGAVLCMGIYILDTQVFGPEKEYRIEDEYYVEYAKDENGTEYVYFNQMTWSSLADTDYFLDAILAGMEQPVERGELENYIDATLLSDTRIVTTSVTAPSAGMAEEIHRLYQQAFLGFSEEYKEIQDISLIKTGNEAELVVLDDRSVRVAVMGAVLGLVLSVFCLYMYIVMDDSFYIPVMLEKRYKIPSKEWDNSMDLPVEETEGLLNKNNDCYAMWVKSGAHNGTRVEKLMMDCLGEGKKVTNIYLVNPDKGLIKAYYATQKFPFYRKNKE